MGITIPRPTGRLLDLTRLVRRAGRRFTGVDRVEFAYLRALLADEVPCWALVRTPFGYLMLDEAGMAQFAQRLQQDTHWRDFDPLGQIAFANLSAQRGVRSFLRGIAVGRSTSLGLAGLVRKHLPVGFNYVNVGHSNLSARVLNVMKVEARKIGIFVHDIIPIEFPQFQREETVRPFIDKMHRVQKFADVIICNSKDTEQRVVRQFNKWVELPQTMAAHLGYDPPKASAPISAKLEKPARPYFVTLGTIEPRKNHVFLLDLWEKLGPEAPGLLICGAFGWNNDAVLARLAQFPPNVSVHPDLCDPDVRHLIAGSKGLLFPSLSEGYGLPAIESLALGTPVLCNDLQVFREVLGENAIYARTSNQYLWIQGIKGMVTGSRDEKSFNSFSPPSWADHFNTVLRTI